MGIFSKFEGHVENAFEGAAGSVFKSPIEPAQIAKRAEKQMNREKLVGAGRQHAPTLYNVLVNPSDNKRLYGFYPTMAAEIETYLMGKAGEAGLSLDGRPLVRFIVDDNLKSGKFDVIAENVAGVLIEQLRQEEMEFYGIASPPQQGQNPYGAPQRDQNPYRSSHGDRSSHYAQPDQPVPYAVPYSAAAGASGQFPAVKNGFADNPALGGAPAIGVDLGAAIGAVGAGAAAGSHAQGMRDVDANRVPDTLSFVGDGPRGKAFLIETKTGRRHELRKTRVIIGREEGSDIMVGDANASRSHAELSQDAMGMWVLVDLGSTNGTQINNRSATKALLRDGDMITIGVTVFEFQEG